jgi:glycosyltransferase involved in cell wall biosynthesis
MIISYAIPVCNEWMQLEYLLNYLLKYKREQDEIIVQCDEGNTTPSVYQVLEEYKDKIQVIEFPLNGDFASFKNNLKDHCSGDYIFQIDADEYPEEYLMNTIEWLINNNPGTDIFWVPRINTVKGLTPEHIQKWGWVVDNDGRVNFPDYQCRILKNVKRIKWKNKVHEVLTGYKTESQLPTNDEFCIHHPKSIERQEKQNKLYSQLQ